MKFNATSRLPGSSVVGSVKALIRGHRIGPDKGICLGKGGPLQMPDGLPEIRIHESELQAMCRSAAEWEDLETGGQLFGFFDRRSSPVVSVATIPSALAEHHKSHFIEDVDVVRRQDEYFREHFGFGQIGRWHSHHLIGLRRPSLGDEKTAASIMAKNRFPCFVELILNLDGGSVIVSPYVYLP